MDIIEAKTRFKELLRVKAAFSRAAAIINHDSMTAAPKNSAPGAAQTLALLSGGERRILEEAGWAELVRGLAANPEGLDGLTRSEVMYCLKELEREIPPELAMEHSRITASAAAAWREAKAANDFSVFLPKLRSVFDSARRIAGAAAPETDVYDFWLDRNEEGASRALLESFFSLIRSEIAPLILEIKKKPAPDDSFLHGRFPIEEQRRFSIELMELMGIDRARCAAGEAEHPYTTFVDRNDVRVTTHYYEDRVTANMFSVMHECGHALYELNVSPELSGSPLSHGASAGMHESQSRFYENIIGRSREFASVVLPLLRAHFPEQFKGVSEEAFFRAVNRVEPSLKRTEADELTYCLHIMIRCELEDRLLHGQLDAADVPAEWNRLYEEYLGVRVPSDKEGCLQDMHWGSGLIGYFPTYALGNAYGAQILAALNREIDVKALTAAGDIPGITAKMTEKICRFGKLRSPGELLCGCCGGGFDPKYYVEYLKNKYSGLYRL